MAKHGNLYWDISFSSLYHGTTRCSDEEKIDVTVTSHDFTDAYNKAEKMYDALLATHPDTVFCAVVTLKDDGTATPAAQYSIYQSNYILKENVAAFFSVGPEKCWRLTWRP